MIHKGLSITYLKSAIGELNHKVLRMDLKRR